MKIPSAFHIQALDDASSQRVTLVCLISAHSRCSFAGLVRTGRASVLCVLEQARRKMLPREMLETYRITSKQFLDGTRSAACQRPHDLHVCRLMDDIILISSEENAEPRWPSRHKTCAALLLFETISSHARPILPREEVGFVRVRTALCFCGGHTFHLSVCK